MSYLWSIKVLKLCLLGEVQFDSIHPLIWFCFFSRFLYFFIHTPTLYWVTGPLGPVVTQHTEYAEEKCHPLWVPNQSSSPFWRKLPLFPNSSLCPDKHPWVDLLPALWFCVIPSSLGGTWPQGRQPEKALTKNGCEGTAQLIKTCLMSSFVEVYSPFS